MISVNLKNLVSKLNDECRRALEGAAGLCLSRSNYNVEIEHWLLKLLELTDGDLPPILRHWDIDVAQVQTELTRSLDKLKTGNSRAPELSLELLDLAQEAWVLSSLEYGFQKIRSGVLLTTLLTERGLRSRIESGSKELAKIPGEQLQSDLLALIDKSDEDVGPAAPISSGDPSAGGQQPSPNSKTPSLDQFTLNLTKRAKDGDIDPVIGRDPEIRQVIDILTRRRQNNPIMTGEAGVGKTAVVEGFALRIAQGDVPDPLKDVSIHSLDLALLQAGAGVKGEFENRLKSVIKEVKASPTPIIMFIDEAHTLIGAGGQAGQGDAANLLKPALARGELRTIAATTWSEYKQYFESDPALTRRFQVVKVEEPEIDNAINMIRGLATKMESHHKVRILGEAVEDAVKLSHRYVTDRKLPDKAVSLLDTACARVALSQSAIPAAVEDCRRGIEMADIEIGILNRETATGVDHTDRIKDLEEGQQKDSDRLADLQKRWEQEKELCAQLQELREKLETHAIAKDAKQEDKKEGQLSDKEHSDIQEQYSAAEKQLIELHGDDPLVQPVVSGQAIAEVVSNWTGVPVGKMVRDEINTVLELQDRLEERVIGQSTALDAMAERIRTARANLVDPRRPIGVFLLVGPSGVGKTETAIALADILYGGDRNMIVVNMSEYKEAAKVSQLIGASKGYVGYGTGGVLTEAVRRRPYSIVLLDEVEKAHEQVHEIFYQVFDKGVLQDSSGNDVNFKNTIILLTSNVGTDTIMNLCADPDTRPDSAGLVEALRPDLLKVFKPALLGRMHIVPFFPLDKDVIKMIVGLNMKKIRARMFENHGATFTYDDSVVETITDRCNDVDSGARNIDYIINGTLLPEMSKELLVSMAEGRQIQKVNVTVNGDGQFQYELS